MTTTVFVTTRHDADSDSPVEVLGVYLTHGDALNAIEEDHEAYFDSDAERVQWGCNGRIGTANGLTYEIHHRPLTN